MGLPENDYFPVGDVDVLAEKLEDVAGKLPEHVGYDMRRYDWEKIVG